MKKPRRRAQAARAHGTRRAKASRAKAARAQKTRRPKAVRARGTRRVAGKRKAPASAATWSRFGADVVVVGDWASAAALPAGARRAGASGGAVRRIPVDARRAHLVVQHGREFQRHHADVPVLVDRGRFLLVDLDPARARKLSRAHPTCYGVTPLGTGRAAFETVARSSFRAAPDPRVAALLTGLERASLESTLTHLAGIPTRHSTGPGFREALAFAEEKLAALGYAVRTQDIDVEGEPSGNLIAEREGTLPAAKRGAVLVTAHLDSVNLAGGPSARAPGADDDGSGSTGVLEIARVLAGRSAGHDLGFLLFGGEEQGLFGSRAYVGGLSAAKRKRIRAVVNMDMIGRKNQVGAGVLLEGAETSLAVMDGLARAAATYTGLAIERSLHPFASDHVPFLDAGIPAVLTIEAADTANTAIHTADDLPALVSYDLMLEILRMNTAYVAAESALAL